MQHERHFLVEKAIAHQVHPDRVELQCVADLERMNMQVRVHGDQIFGIRMQYGATKEAAAQAPASDIVLAPPQSGFSVKEEAGALDISTKTNTLRIEFDPWRIVLLDSDGRTLAESLYDDFTLTGQRYSPGAGVCVLADDLNTDWDIRWEHQKSYLTLRLRHDERVWGGGEKFTAFDRRGQRLTMWNIDTLGTRSELAYKNIPFFISSRGYGLYIDNTDRVELDIGNQSIRALSATAPGGVLDFYLIAGETPRQILEHYTSLTGRPALPPRWSFGLWISTCFDRLDRQRAEALTAQIRESAIPCDVFHFDCFWLRDHHWCDLTWDESRFPNPAEMLAGMKAKGFRICVWTNPFVSIHSEMFKEGDAKGYFLRRPNGETYVANLWLDLQPAMGVVDFTNPEAVAWYKEKHRKLMEMGVDTFKTDFGEDLPVDAVYANGRPATAMHNLYPLLYQGAVFEAVKETASEGIIWARAACAGSQRYPTHWSGDPGCTFDDMAAVLRAGLSNSLSGLAFWSHDVGGFKGVPTRELYIRWAQFGFLSPHVRCHSQTPRFPWEFDEEATAIFRSFAELRYRMLPYIYSYAHEAAATGVSPARPMMLEFPADPACYVLDAQYMFGREILVAPVLSEGGQVTFYLPEGQWCHLLDGEIVEGGRWLARAYELDSLPVFIRENSLVPTGPLMAYDDGSEADSFLVDAFVTSAAEFHLQDRGVNARLTALRTADRLQFSVEAASEGFDPAEKTWEVRLRGVSSVKQVLCGEKPIGQLTEEARQSGRAGWWQDELGVVIRLEGNSCEAIL